MADPILDELWRVREQLIREHGGLHAYYEYLRRLEREQRQRLRRRRQRHKKASAKSPG
jgi:hypothetical protein